MTRLLLFFIAIAIMSEANSQQQLRNISDGSDVTAIVFLAVDCPISQKYIPALNAIHEKYKQPKFKIHAVIPGKIKERDIANFKEEYGIAFNVSADRGYELVKALSANATPEVFVFNKELKLKYRGAIDNWFYELGGYRTEATEDYLINAVDALLAGGQPEIEKTKALGCTIQVPGQR